MRVSDNTSRGAVHDALGRTKGRIEELQIKNATLKKINAPSDDPVGNAKILDIRTQSAVNKQFESNAQVARDRLQHIDNALGEITDLLVRAKEIALNQSSGASATADSRIGVAQEVSQLYKQLVAVANRRIGDNYIFSGYKTTTSPYTTDGVYKGDMGETAVEVQKGVFSVTNLPGPKVFQAKRFLPENLAEAEMFSEAEDRKKTLPQESLTVRGPASEGQPPKQSPKAAEVVDVFKAIETLKVGLLANDTHTVRGTLEALDTLIESTISTRAKVGSRAMGVDASMQSNEKQNLQNAAVQSNLEDADYAELWSSLAKEESVFRASLSAAQKLIQPTLLDFIK